MSQRNRWTQLAFAVVVALLVVPAPVTRVDAQGIIPCMHEARFGLVSLARLQDRAAQRRQCLTTRSDHAA